MTDDVRKLIAERILPGSVVGRALLLLCAAVDELHVRVRALEDPESMFQPERGA